MCYLPSHTVYVATANTRHVFMSSIDARPIIKLPLTDIGFTGQRVESLTDILSPLKHCNMSICAMLIGLNIKPPLANILDAGVPKLDYLQFWYNWYY